MELAENDSSNSNDANNSSAHNGTLGQSTTSVDGSDSGFFDAQQSITKDVSMTVKTQSGMLKLVSRTTLCCVVL
jgi:hypothetical protein